MLNLDKELEYVNSCGAILREVYRSQKDNKYVCFEYSDGVLFTLSLEEIPYLEQVRNKKEDKYWNNFSEIPLNAWFKNNISGCLRKIVGISTVTKNIRIGSVLVTIDELGRYYKYTLSDTPFDEKTEWLCCKV